MGSVGVASPEECGPGQAVAVSPPGDQRDPVPAADRTAVAGPAIPLREVTDGPVTAGVARSPSSSRTTNPIRRDATVVTCGDARSSTPFRNPEANGLTAKAAAAGVAVRGRDRSFPAGQGRAVGRGAGPSVRHGRQQQLRLRRRIPDSCPVGGRSAPAVHCRTPRLSPRRSSRRSSRRDLPVQGAGRCRGRERPVRLPREPSGPLPLATGVQTSASAEAGR